MSRIGKLPITIPAGVTVSNDSGIITVNGSKGELKQFVLDGVSVSINDNELLVTRDNDELKSRGNHGLMRSLIDNMVQGVQNGFSKKLEINGVGYKVSMAGSDLKLNLGFSHDVNFKLPAGVMANIEQNVITISGISKQQVGQIAAEIRSLRKPEPYKGKGIKYVGERIIRKSGKSGKEK
ncbi:MAG TPA: 50S ribosomal protein L6 [Candidatus Saccharimonadales bacterium]|nr:50S ribosomal protein L6 [Candidatus Saccharimonadales bacterium]